MAGRTLAAILATTLLAAAMAPAPAADRVSTFRFGTQAVAAPTYAFGEGAVIGNLTGAAAEIAIPVESPWPFSNAPNAVKVRLVEGTLPTGATVTEDGLLSIKPFETLGRDYSLTVEATNAAGVSSRRSFHLTSALPPIADASTLLPTGAAAASGSFPALDLYDGSYTTRAVAAGETVTVTFDRWVLADRAASFLVGSSSAVDVSWTGLDGAATTPRRTQLAAGQDGEIAFGTTAVAKEFRFTFASATTLSDLRVGAHPVEQRAPLSIAEAAQSSLSLVAGQPWSVSMTASGGRPSSDPSKAYSFSLSPALPTTVAGTTTLAANASGTSFAITGYAPQGTYGPYTVTATDSTGVSTTSVPFTVDVSGPAYSMVSWGQGSEKTLAIDTTANVLVPTAAAPGMTFTSIAAGYKVACGLASDGQAWCWGNAGFGTLGNGTSATSTLPVKVQGNIRFDRLAAGGMHVCGIARDGYAWCWGYNVYGQGGNGSTSPSITTVPTAVAGQRRYKDIAAGEYFTCAVDVDGKAWCWGYNTFGTLGNNTTSNSASPVAVSTTAAFKAISAGSNHACAIRSNPGLPNDGTLMCWGYNGNNAINGGSTSQFLTPTSAGGYSYKQISMGLQHSCGITTSGAAYCWGRRFLANGAGTSNWTTPTLTAGKSDFDYITAGTAVTCGLKDGSVWCFGGNDYGQIGIGSTGGSYPSMTKVSGSWTYSAIDAATYGVTALRN